MILIFDWTAFWNSLGLGIAIAVAGGILWYAKAQEGIIPSCYRG